VRQLGCGNLTIGVIQELACVRLELENRPQNVALVRAALSGLAEAGEFDEELATDLKTAVSEACNNVVLHAYEGGPGPMYITAHTGPERIDVVVTDHGTGIKRLSGATDHMGLGLALISALADQAEFRSPNEGGTEVRMRFRRTAEASEAGIPPEGAWRDRPQALTGDVVMWCEPVSLLRHVLGRVARAVAAGSHFTMSGAADLYAINDAVAEYAEAAADGHVVTAISGASHRLTLDAGPFAAFDHGGDDELADDDWPGTEEIEARQAAIARLVDQLSFEADRNDGLLHVLLLDHGRDPVQ
jgi:serine/threonine-protein kinase RsbW